jgi:hypothetical protein
MVVHTGCDLRQCIVRVMRGTQGKVFDDVVLYSLTK